jgi:hypothetical protein
MQAYNPSFNNSNGELASVTPNHSLNLTLCGRPRMALISFWAMRGLPQSAG